MCLSVCGAVVVVVVVGWRGGGDTGDTPSLLEFTTAMFCQRTDGCSVTAAEEAEAEGKDVEGVNRRRRRFPQ